MSVDKENNQGNQSLKRFLVFNKLETDQENKEFAEEARVSETVLYNLVSGKTKRANWRTAEAIVEAANKRKCSVKLTMKDLGHE